MSTASERIVLSSVPRWFRPFKGMDNTKFVYWIFGGNSWGFQDGDHEKLTQIYEALVYRSDSPGIQSAQNAFWTSLSKQPMLTNKEPFKTVEEECVAYRPWAHFFLNNLLRACFHKNEVYWLSEGERAEYITNICTAVKTIKNRLGDLGMGDSLGIPVFDYYEQVGMKDALDKQGLWPVYPIDSPLHMKLFTMNVDVNATVLLDHMTHTLEQEVRYCNIMAKDSGRTVKQFLTFYEVMVPVLQPLFPNRYQLQVRNLANAILYTVCPEAYKDGVYKEITPDVTKRLSRCQQEL